MTTARQNGYIAKTRQKYKRKDVSLLPEQLDLIERAAAKQGHLQIAEWIRTTLVAAANRILGVK
jgi:hypothetical protein